MKQTKPSLLQLQTSQLGTVSTFYRPRNISRKKTVEFASSKNSINRKINSCSRSRGGKKQGPMYNIIAIMEKSSSRTTVISSHVGKNHTRLERTSERGKIWLTHARALTGAKTIKSGKGKSLAFSWKRHYRGAPARPVRKSILRALSRLIKLACVCVCV